MPDLDTLAPNYRRARERWPEAQTLCGCHDSLSACFNRGSHGLVEHVKSFLESVCVTILGEYNQPMPSSTASSTELLVAALSALGLENTRGASKMSKVLSAFNRLANALSEMRNDHGVVAHGRDGFLDEITSDQARAFVHTGDAILGVLLSALDGREPNLLATREPYERFSTLHERIDRAVGVDVWVDEDGDTPMVVVGVASGPRDEAIELRIEPSRLLYGVDREVYVEVLKTAQSVAEESNEYGLEERSEREIGGLAPSESTSTAVEIEIMENYQGQLAGLKPELKRFLEAEAVELGSGGDGLALPDSLLSTLDRNLGLDWQQRESIQARLRIASKRVLLRFGSDSMKADDVAERLISWLRIQAPGARDSNREGIG